MNGSYCYMPTKLDKRLSHYLISRNPQMSSWSPKFIASLRGSYDSFLAETNGELVEMDGYVDKVSPLWQLDEEDDANLHKIAATLIKFRNEKKAQQLDQIKHLNSNKAEIWSSISENFSNIDLFYRRSSQLAFYFVQVIDNFIEEQEKKGNIITREQVIRGIPMLKDGKIRTNKEGKAITVIDANKILDTVFNQFMEDYSFRMNQEGLSDEQRLYYQKEYEKIFNPSVWAAMVINAKAMLKNMEGLKLSLTDMDVEVSNFDDFMDHDSIAAVYDAEEDVREGWQVWTDCLSAYGSLSREVRRALSRITIKVKDPSNETIFIEAKGKYGDDLGYPRRMNAVDVHQKLSDLLRNCRKKSQMMKRIGSVPEFGGLYEELKNNQYLQTQLFNDFRKVFQPYMQLSFGFDKIKAYILNRTNAEHAIGNYMFTIKYNPSIKKNSMANTSRFGWRQEDVEKLKTLLNQFITVKENGKTINDFWRLPASDMKNRFREIFDALAIQYNDSVLDRLVGDKKMLSSVIKSFSSLAKYSNLYKMEGTKVVAMQKTFYDWVTLKDSNAKADHKTGENQEKINNILTILQKCGNGIMYENKCRTINKNNQSVTYSGNVQSNFMGDLIGKINSFTEAITAEEKQAAREEFKKWLKDKYFKSTQFCDKFDNITGEPEVSGIKNAWLRNLWEEANAAEYNQKHAKEIKAGTLEEKLDMFHPDSFTSQFQFVRVVTGKYGSKVIPFENFTEKQHYEQLISSYFYFETLRNGIFDEYVYVPVFVLGDSGVCKMLKVKRITKYDDYVEGIDKKRTLNVDPVINELYNVFTSELRRMTQFQKFIKQEKEKGNQVDRNMEENQDKFTLLPFLNDEVAKLGEHGLETLKNYSESKIKDLIKTALESKFNRFLELGIDLKAIGDTNVLTKEDLVKANDVNKKFKANKVKKNQGSKAVEVGDFQERIKEVFYNTYLANILQFQMFTTDLGFYAGIKDFQKRYKEVHAPGNTLDVEAVDVWNDHKPVSDGIERVKYVNDISIDFEHTNPEMAKVVLRVHAQKTELVEQAIKEGITVPKENKAEETARIARLKDILGTNFKIYDKFRKSTQTDGQAWRIIDSYRKVMIMAGQWDATKEALYKKIDQINKAVIAEDRDITEEELREISAYAKVFQPLKPYLFGMESYDIKDATNPNKTVDTMFIPVQHKYAEDILIPCLLPKGSKIRELAVAMQDQKLDLVASDKCVKVGAWGQTNIEEEVEGNVNIAANLAKGVEHHLNYEDYRIQSNVPEHINVERALGTQVRKLIMGNINMFTSEEYNYLTGYKGFKEAGGIKITGKEKTALPLTGKNLVSLYTSLIVANMMQSFARFQKNIQNKQKLSNLLTSAIVSNDRYALHQLLDIAIHDGEVQEFNTPLYEGTIEHDTTAMIFSMFRKEVNKQSMKGGSAVQVSDWGITTKEEATGKDRPLKFVTDKEGTNVLYAEIEIPFNFSYTNSRGEEVHLNFNDYCLSNGEFRSAVDESRAVREGEQSKLEKDFPGITDIVAYRIPSERDYSILNCKVVRCTDPTAGGTIRVPAQGTTIAGFDFDIDKLYLIRKEFRMKRVNIEDLYSDPERNKIFAKLYELDAAKHRDAEEDTEQTRITKHNNNIYKAIDDLGEDSDWYEFIDDASENLFNLDYILEPKWDNLEESQKAVVDKNTLINGEDLYNFVESWMDSGVEISNTELEAIDKDKIYNGKEVFHILFDRIADKVSEKGWNLYDNIETFDYFDEDYISKDSIVSKLRKIREDSGEWKEVEFTRKNGSKGTRKKYAHALNYYWDIMVEQNPYMEDNEEYSKNTLFEQAAKEIGLWKEKTYEEVLDEYDFTKGVAQNSRTCRNNLIFELMRQRLMDKETLKDRLTPGGFDSAIRAATKMKVLMYADTEEIIGEDGKVDMAKVDHIVDKIEDGIRPDPEPEYDAADPETLMYFNQLNQVAGKLIGIMANQNTNHQLTSIVKKAGLLKAILFDGMLDGKAEILDTSENTAGYDEATMKGLLGSTLLAKRVRVEGKIIDTDENLAAFLAAAVDAVKSPALNYLFFNVQTASTGALLARLGYPLESIGLLFKQPIIKDMCDIINNSGGIKQINAAIKEVLQKYTGKDYFEKNISTEMTSVDLATHMHRYEALKKNAPSEAEALKDYRNEASADFRNFQVRVLYSFREAYLTANELNNYISTTKFTASNAVGSSMGFFYNQQAKVDQYINQDPVERRINFIIYDSGEQGVDKSINVNNDSSLINDRNAYIESQKDNPFAFEQCMYDLNKELLKTLEAYYPYNRAIYANKREAITNMLPPGMVLDAETIDNIHRETTQHMLLQQNDNAFDPRSICEDNAENEEYSNRDYYLYKFPILLFELYKNGKLPEYISRYLNFSFYDTKNEDTGDVLKQLNVSVNLAIEQADKNSFTDAWAQLALGNEELQKIAKGLFFHNYYKLGFVTGPYSFSQFTPLEVKQLLKVGTSSYLDYISIDNLKYLDAFETGDRVAQSALEFGYMFALNHVENSRLVHRMPRKKGDGQYASLFQTSGIGVKSAFTLNFSTMTADGQGGSEHLCKEFVKKEIKDSDHNTVGFEVYPVIMYDKMLYVAKVNGKCGYTAYTNGVGFDTVVYERVKRLGYKGMSNIYARTLDEAMSIATQSNKSLEAIESSMSEIDKLALLFNAQSAEGTNTEIRSSDTLSEAPAEAPVEEHPATETGNTSGQAPVVTPVTSSTAVRNNDNTITYNGIIYQEYTELDNWASIRLNVLDSIGAYRQAAVDKILSQSPAGAVIIPSPERDVNNVRLKGKCTVGIPIGQVENTIDEDAAGSTGTDTGTEVDVDSNALEERLQNCDLVTEDLLIDYIVRAANYERQMEGKPIFIDDNEAIVDTMKQGVKDEINRRTQEYYLAHLEEAGHATDADIRKIRKKFLVQQLVSDLIGEIKSGNREVYTSLTKEKIC